MKYIVQMNEQDAVRYGLSLQTLRKNELIRCKDCRWYMRTVLKGDGTEDMRYKPDYCEWWMSYTKEHDYCSYAERKEE